jgi:phosphatidylglycerophosphatase A
MKKIINSTIMTLASFFYLGYLPLIPGTFGSIGGIVLYFFIKDSPAPLALFTFILIVLGFLISGEAERIANKKDARCIVIDEACGMLVSLLFIPYSIKIVIVGFFLFRLLDTLKPYPAGRLERLKGSVGIMSDDLVAGIYTNIILQTVLRFISFRIS